MDKQLPQPLLTHILNIITWPRTVPVDTLFKVTFVLTGSMDPTIQMIILRILVNVLAAVIATALLLPVHITLSHPCSRYTLPP
jgi:hypothetical protein